jgi:5'-3' exonuclease
MGIEGFFNYLVKKKESVHVLDRLDDVDFLLFDFNSVIHVATAGMSAKNEIDEDTETQFIVEAVLFHLGQFLEKHCGKFKTMGIYLDGVPMQSKMIEQRHRRYMGTFIEKYKVQLTGEESHGWSKIHISPATQLMYVLEKELTDPKYKDFLKQTFECEKLVVSSTQTAGEAEFKLIQDIQLWKQDSQLKNKKIAIYSPDADLIPLTILQLDDYSNCQYFIIRHDQQDSEKAGEQVYYEINVNEYMNEISQYFSNQLHNTANYKDLVFIFNLFGNDFIPKLPTYSNKYDFAMIIVKYLEALAETNQKSMIQKRKNDLFVHPEVFFVFIAKLAEEEENVARKNFLNRNFVNYQDLIFRVNKHIRENNGYYNSLTHSNVGLFLTLYNFSRDYDYLTEMNIYLKRKYMAEHGTRAKVTDMALINQLSIDVSFEDYLAWLKTNETFKQTLTDLASVDKYPFRHFIEEFSRHVDKTDFLRKLRDLIKDPTILKRIDTDDENFIDTLDDEQVFIYILLYAYHSPSSSMPILVHYLAPIDDLDSILSITIQKRIINYIGLRHNKRNISNPFYMEKTKSMTDVEKEVFQMSKLLGKYRDVLKANSKVELGNYQETDFDMSVSRYYKEFFGIDHNDKNALDQVITKYLEGFMFIFRYYMLYETLPTWFYPYTRAPLITDVYEYLLRSNRKNTLEELRHELDRHQITDMNRFFTPVEHFMYVTPFDPSDNNESMIKQYMFEGYHKFATRLASFVASNVLKLYFKLDDVLKLATETNEGIDCRDVAFLNKCYIDVLHEKNNDVSASDFIGEMRKTIPYDEQVGAGFVLVGGYNDLDKTTLTISFDKTVEKNIAKNYLKYKKRFQDYPSDRNKHKMMKYKFLFMMLEQ